MHDARVRTGQCSGSMFASNHCPEDGLFDQGTYNGIEIHMSVDPVCFDSHEMSGIREKARCQRTVEI